MKIKNWIDFLNESVLITSNKFKNYLFNIGDNVSSALMGIIDRDIDTNYNFLDISGENSKIRFTPDNQAQRKISQGQTIDSLFKSGSTASIGRIVKSILSQNGFNFSDSEIESFVNKFKAEWDNDNLEDNNILVINGDEIKKWYSEKSYVYGGKGTLGNSCMRYDYVSDFLDIYTSNIDQVSLVIYVDKSNLLRARALLWKTNKGYYLDRVYYTIDSEDHLLNKWVAERYKLTKDPVNAYIDLTYGNFDQFPYLDSFQYYSPTQNRLSMNVDNLEQDVDIYILNKTDGSYEYYNRVWCEFDGEYCREEDAVYSDYFDVYILKDNAIKCDVIDSYVHVDHTVKDDTGRTILREHSFLVYLDSDDDQYVYMHYNELGKKFYMYVTKDNQELICYHIKIKTNLLKIEDLIKYHIKKIGIKRENSYSSIVFVDTTGIVLSVNSLNKIYINYRLLNSLNIHYRLFARNSMLTRIALSYFISKEFNIYVEDYYEVISTYHQQF